MAIAELVVNLIADTGKFISGMEKAAGQVKKAGAQIESAGKSIMGLTAPLAAFGAYSLKTFADFDSKSTQSTAIMGKLSDEMRGKMVSAADEVARTTTFSASRAAESYFFLASAGLDASQSIAALPQVAIFAQAGMFDMARATDLATDAQSALGMTVKDASENLANLTRVTDVLVKANTLANASVEQFSEALTTRAGASLKNAGKDIEEGVAVLAAFADQGVKGAEAGTALGIVMRDLQTQFRKNTEEFNKAGVAVFDSKGNFNNLGVVVGQLEQRLEGMSAQQRNATLAQLGFTDKSVAFIQTLLGTSDKIKAYEESLRSAGGATKEVADKQLTSFNSQIKLLKNEVEIASRVIGEQLAPKVLEIARQIKSAVQAFANLSTETKQQIVDWGLFAAKLGLGLIVIGKVLQGASGLFMIFTRLNPIVLGVTAAVAAGILVWSEFGDELTQLYENTIQAIKEEFPNAFAVFKHVGGAVVQGLIDAFRALWDTIKLALSALNAVIDYIPILGTVTTRVKELGEQQRQAAEQTAIYERNTKKAIEALGGMDNIKAKFEAAKKGVVDFGLGLLGVKKEAKETVPEIKKGAAEVGELDKGAKKAASALKGLQDKWADLNRSFREKELKKSIEEAVKAGNEAELAPLLESLKKNTKEGILAGMEDAAKEGGPQAAALAETIAEAEADAIIKEEEGRIADAIKSNREKVYTENADFWRGKMEDAVTQTRFSWKDQIEKAMVDSASKFLASFEGLKESFEGIGADLAEDFGAAISESFDVDIAADWGAEMGGAFSSGIEAATMWYVGEVSSALEDQGSQLFSGRAPDADNLSDSERASYSAATFGISEAYFAAAHYARKWWGGGSNNPATQAREAFARELNGLIDGKNIRIFDENGVLQEIDKISLGSRHRFNKPWAEAFFELTGDAQSAFLGVGYALQNLFGITEDIGGQMAAILADNVGGSLQNLALLLIGMEIPITDMETAMVQAFNEGSISAHDFSVYMQGINQAYAEAETAQNDLGLAIQLWLGTNGQGEQSVRSFQGVITAAMNQGIKTIEGFVQQAVASGVLTAAQGDQLMRAFAAHGITSMDQIANASDATFIHIMGSLQSMEKEGENSFFGLSEKMEENFNTIEKRWERIRQLPPAELEMKIKVTGDKAPVDIAPESIKTTAARIPALDTGGIVTSPTLALIGEKRSEAVIPLQELPSMMKNLFDSTVSTGRDMAKNVFNIDARGAQRGVADEIKRALLDFGDVRNGLLGTT